MTKPTWNKTLAEALGHETQVIKKISPKTGSEYNTDAIPVLNVLSTGSVEAMPDGKFRYSIVDSKKELEYSIKVDNKVEVQFGTALSFKMVVGGSFDNGGSWYSAESVQIATRSA